MTNLPAVAQRTGSTTMGRIGGGVGVNLVPWPPVQHSPYAYPAQAAAYAGAYPVWQVQGGPQLYTEQDYGGGFAGADARTQMMVLSAARKTAAPAMVRAAARKTAAPAMVRAKKARRRAKKARFSQPGAVPTDCGVWCVEQYCADPVLKDGKFQCPTDWQNFMVSGCIDKWCRGQVPPTPAKSRFSQPGAVPTDCGVWCVDQYCADPVLKDGKFQCPTDWQNFMVSGCIDKWCRGQVPSTPNPSSFAFAGAGRTRASGSSTAAVVRPTSASSRVAATS